MMTAALAPIDFRSPGWPPGWPARPLGGFGLVVADPPWRFELRDEATGKAKSPQGQYDCMTLAEIHALPVGDLMARDSVCLLWATAPMLVEGIATLGAWGFEYKTAGVWAKRSPTGKTWAFGTGFILRSAAEIWLIGTRGSPSPRNRSTRNLIEAPQREHSRKPDEMIPLIEGLFSGPYLELFARTTRPGWTVWGNQTDRFPTAERGAS